MQQRRRQPGDDRLLLNYSDLCQCCYAKGRCARVSYLRLAYHERRHKEFKMGTLILPPVASHLLICGKSHIPARLRGQIADDGGLDVDGWFHGPYITKTRTDGQPTLTSCAYLTSSYTRTKSTRNSSPSASLSSATGLPVILLLRYHFASVVRSTNSSASETASFP